MHRVILTPSQLKKPADAYTNCVFISSKTLSQFSSPPNRYLTIKGLIFQYKIDNSLINSIGLNKLARTTLRISMTDSVQVQGFQPKDDDSMLFAELPVNQSQHIDIDDQQLNNQIQSTFKNFVINQGQTLLLMHHKKYQLYLNVQSVKRADMGLGIKRTATYGLIDNQTDIQFKIKWGNKIKLKSQRQATKNIFKPDFKFQDMKIGGLDSQLANIFRRAFASRRFPPAMIQKYGIKHVKGMLLYGPPGTGKTLIARQLSKALKAKQPIIVNGPQIFGRYVGQSQQNIRKLFKDAKSDSLKLGQDSPLHVIVFDQIDAIAKPRGTTNTGTTTHDTVVNQLLTNIDGVDSLDNILVIGMTNRKDLIDQAVLRAGRFQVHIQVGLPDQKGRQQIFNIHTQSMVKNNILGNSVDINLLAKQSGNYTGAEIQAVVKSAASFSMSRAHNLTDFTKPIQLDKDYKVQMQDFQAAFQQVKPLFGKDSERLQVYVRRPLINYGIRFDRVRQIFQNAFKQARQGKNTQLTTLLLQGCSGSGTTSIAAHAAQGCQFPFVKMISPDQFVGYSQSGKINAIVKIFEDAYRSRLSCIILDNLLRLIEWVDVGMRLSNPILQTILVLLNKIPKKAQNRLIIIGTTSDTARLQSVELLKAFQLRVPVPKLNQQQLEVIFKDQGIRNQTAKEFATMMKTGPIKTALAVLDMVGEQQENTKFKQVLEAFNFD